MLLRSTSAPILKSWVHQSSPEMDLGIQIRTVRPVSMFLSSSSSFPIDNSMKKMYRTLSESDSKEISKPKPKLFPNGYSHVVLEDPEKEEDKEEEEEMGMAKSLKTLFSSSGLDESTVVGVDEECAGVVGGGGGGGGGCGGGGGDEDGGSGYWDWDHGNESVDGYYKKMIRAYPGNALILGNYARFLKEVRGDVVKAEEYCVRAILAEPSDGYVLSLYGDLIWHTHKDASRAQSYFDQALKSAPDDCYVLASYARFIWDAEDEEEEEEQEKDGSNSSSTCASPPNFFQKHPPLPPLAASS